MQQLTKELNLKLKTLKAQYVTILNADENTYKDRIDEIVSRAYTQELYVMAEECEGDIDVLIGLDVEDLVIPREDIFENILNEELSKVNYMVEEIVREARSKRDYNGVKIHTEDFRLVFTCGDFRSHSYEKAKRRYMKQNNRVYTSAYTRMSESVYLKQREILAKLLDVNMSIDTVCQLKKFSFIEHNLKDIVAKMYSTLATGYKYCPLFLGDEIDRGLMWLDEQTQKAAA